jgi:hypothetical protein
MKKFNYLLFICFISLLFSCINSKYKYWDISKFNIDNNALEDNEEVKIIYTSRGPDSNTELNYYIHLIAISQKSGDTVNILTTPDNGLEIEDKDKVFNFFNQDNIATKITQEDLYNLKDIKSLDIKEIEKKELKKIDKVARDPEFDYMADNNYKTIIGVIGVNAP